MAAVFHDEQGGADMTKALNLDALLCTAGNSTRHSIASLLQKVAPADTPPADPAAVEKLNLMRAHLEGLLETMEDQDNYKVNWN